tara:strand:- start:2243 stop:2821 length:579 start_codon:yes stop_codon:yes gene_type:complete
MNIKKAAMFGLDARIALAIFGALSVISGAALYSAIKESKLVAFYTTTQEVIKAMEALYLDTGTLDKYSGNANCFDVNDLINDNSNAGWSGPYIAAASATDDGGGCINLNGIIEDTGSLRIRQMFSEDWADAANFNGNACDGSKDCSLWIHYSVTDIDAAELDKRFDDAEPNKGNIRHTSNNTYLYIKGFNYN